MSSFGIPPLRRHSAGPLWKSSSQEPPRSSAEVCRKTSSGRRLPEGLRGAPRSYSERALLKGLRCGAPPEDLLRHTSFERAPQRSAFERAPSKELRGAPRRLLRRPLPKELLRQTSAELRGGPAEELFRRGIPERPPRTSAEAFQKCTSRRALPRGLRGAPRTSADLRGALSKGLFQKSSSGGPPRSSAEAFWKSTFESAPPEGLRGGRETTD